MGPNKRPIETNGVVVRQPIMGGRYFLADFDVEMLPGAKGKLEKVNFKGKSIEGYDNVKKKFISIWIDNASTGPTIFEGSMILHHEPSLTSAKPKRNRVRKQKCAK